MTDVKNYYIFMFHFITDLEMFYVASVCGKNLKWF